MPAIPPGIEEKAGKKQKINSSAKSSNPIARKHERKKEEKEEG
jgi:hypothetical protein